MEHKTTNELQETLTNSELQELGKQLKLNNNGHFIITQKIILNYIMINDQFIKCIQYFSRSLGIYIYKVKRI